MLCGSLDRREIWGRVATCICTAESLHYSPETITALLIGYTSIQNERLIFKKKPGPDLIFEETMRESGIKPHGRSVYEVSYN